MSAPAGAEAVTEIGCASRTQLLDIDTGSWDEGLLELFGVPGAALPRVVASTGPFPGARGLDPVPDGTPVLAVMADSHAALFAHRGWRPGIVKCTYGTGSSVMAVGPRGDRDVRSLLDDRLAGRGRRARSRGEHPLDRPHHVVAG